VHRTHAPYPIDPWTQSPTQVSLPNLFGRSHDRYGRPGGPIGFAGPILTRMILITRFKS